MAGIPARDRDGSALLRHRVVLARAAGLSELAAEVIADKVPMQRVLERCGLAHELAAQGGGVHIALRLR